MPETIVCVGRLREAFWAEAAAEYEKRLSRFTRLTIAEAPDLPEPPNASDAQRRQVMEKEGREILARLRPDDFVVALCIDAPQLKSEELAALVRQVADSGHRLAFVIGGSLGLSGEVTARANRRLSMSKLTFPHQLARVMLLEQLYRAHKINAGERYHK